MQRHYQTPDGQLFVVGEDTRDLDFAIGGDYMIGDDEDFYEGDEDEYGEDDDDDEFGEDYLIGDDELDPLFGDDDVEFGASRRRRSRRRRGRKATTRMARLRRAAVARAAGGFSARRKPVVTQGYKLTLPFSQAFGIGATGTITLTPQRSFRLKQLVVGDSNSALFQLNSLNVGQDNQFIASGALNMEVFSNLSAQKVELSGSTANLGTTIVLNVTNLDAAAQTLSGMLMGPTILSVG